MRARTSTPVAPLAVAAARLSSSIVWCHSGSLEASTTPDRISATGPPLPRTLLSSHAVVDEVEETLRVWASGDMRMGAEEEAGVEVLERGDIADCWPREGWVRVG